MTIARFGRYAAAVMLLAACGGGGGNNGNNGNNQVGSTPSASVTVTFPNLFTQSGTKVLPTYISHIVSSDRYPLASISVTNTGPALGSLQVSIDLPTYGSPGVQTISLAQGETKKVTISPVIDYAQLFQNTTALPATINVSVTAGSAPLFQQSYPIQITGRDTVFWNFDDGSDASMLVVAMVTPQDKAGKIEGLLRGAAAKFVASSDGTDMVNGLVGYQPLYWPQQSETISAGQYDHEDLYVLAGETPSVTLDALTGAATIPVYILDDANFNSWVAGSSATACGIDKTAAVGTTVTCQASAEGWFHVVYVNPGAASLTVTRHRPMSSWEVTYYQSAAIFDQLRADGILYVNLPGTGFFSQSQNVRYPSESLAMQSANCIDGSLVFASAWEALGMQPIIASAPQHGHAFVAVRCWQDSDCVVPVETTMVGSSYTFDDAFNYATQNWVNWTGDNTVNLVDVEKARSLGITPAPM